MLLVVQVIVVVDLFGEGFNLLFRLFAGHNEGRNLGLRIGYLPRMEHFSPMALSL
jgi:hypothetical protein